MRITDLNVSLEGIELLRESLYRGKANDVYKTTNLDILAIISTDRISAGNGAKKDEVPGKGRSNHVFSVTAFERLGVAGIHTHYLGEDRETNTKFVRATTPIKLEVIARYEAAWSFCKYANVPAGTPMIDANGDPFVEFTYKSDHDGDPRISDWSVVQMDLLSQEEVDEVRSITKRVANIVKELAEEVGCKFIDFKIEFGRTSDGKIIVIDEISPDTCRMHDIATGRKLDKDNFRDGESNEVVHSGYAEMERRILNLRSEAA